MGEKEIKVLDKGKVALLDVMGSDKSIVEAARISYSSNKQKTVGDDTSLIRYLMRHNHTSVFEMVEIKFYLKLPIFVHNQIVRHRTASQNVLSGRYSEMPDEFYIPEEDKVTFQNPTNKQGGTAEIINPFNIKNPDDWWDCLTPEQVAESWNWKYYFEEEQKLNRHNYEKYLKSGMRKELSRINLPLSQYTELYWKIDLHNLFHFLKLRLDSHAQYEVRVYAEAMYELIKSIVPIACQAFEDYILNSMTLSAIEVKALNEYLLNVIEEHNLDFFAAKYFENKRERNEFIEKVKILYY